MMKTFDACLKPARVLLAAVLATGSALAQSAPASTPVADDVIELSPFVVSTDKDRGFVAASSLAGGRIATDMKDTPVAYSVITRDFIDALGITDLNAAASWTPNTAVVVSGNGGGFGEDIAGFAFGVTVRGGGQGDQQRNFFYYRTVMDSYALERYDFGRGPNAILFGNGTLGGVNSSTTKQARFDRDVTVVKQDIGSWNRFRTELDHNQVVNDRLAVRIASVYEDSEGWRDRQFSKMKAVFGTATFKLGAHTSLRLDAELGEFSRQQTNTNLIDNLSGWDGVTTYAGPITTPIDNAVHGPLGVNKRGANYFVWDPYSGFDAVMNYENDPFTRGSDNTPFTPIGNYVRATNPNMPAFGVDGAWIVDAYNIPANRFDRAVQGSQFRIPDRKFNMNFDAPTITNKFHDLQLTLDHKIGNIFLQVSADTNEVEQEIFAMDARGNNRIFVDINQKLPNGAVNRHFLTPYSDSDLRYQNQVFSHDGIRGAAGTEWDWDRWGRYRVNLLGGYAEITQSYSTYNLSVRQNPDRRRWGASGRDLGMTDLIKIRNYWNEPRPFEFRTDPIRFVDPIRGVDKQVTPALTLENDRTDSAQVVRSIYGYGLASLQAKYFEDKLVLLGAVRVDNFYNHSRQQLHAGDYDPINWDGVSAMYKSNAPADYWDMKFTTKDANGNPTSPAQFALNRPRDGNGNRNPLYSGDRFRSDYNSPAVKGTEVTNSVGLVYHFRDWFSPYINYAQTFNPPRPIQRLDSSMMDPTVAEGIDMGIRMNLLDGRIVLNALYYDNSEENNGFNPGIPVNSIIAARPAAVTDISARNNRGVPLLPATFDDIRDREARGYEFELTANITSAWRMMANFGHATTYTSNGYQDTIPYLEANIPVFRQILQDAGVAIDSNNVATVDANVPGPKLDANGAANQWNQLMTYRQGLTTARVKNNEQRTANFFNDYTFQTGFLNKLRLGAGIQWRGKQILDNRGADTIIDPSNPARAIDDPSVGATDYYYTEPYWWVLATVGYTFQLDHNRTLDLNLRIDNLLTSGDHVQAQGGVYRPRDGDYSSPARERVPFNYQYTLPTSYTLTARLSF